MRHLADTSAIVKQCWMKMVSYLTARAFERFTYTCSRTRGIYQTGQVEYRRELFSRLSGEAPMIFGGPVFKFPVPSDAWQRLKDLLAIYVRGKAPLWPQCSYHACSSTVLLYINPIPRPSLYPSVLTFCKVFRRQECLAVESHKCTIAL